MSPNDTPDERWIDAEQKDSVRSRPGRGVATGEVDESLVELLTWLLGSDTRARIYLYLRQQPRATSDEIATGTGLYPSTVRESLVVLHEEGTVSRHERELCGVEDSRYVYEVIPPKELVLDILEPVQEKLNTVFMLDELLGVTENSERTQAVSRDPIQHQFQEHDHQQEQEQDQEHAKQQTPISITVTETAFRADEQ